MLFPFVYGCVSFARRGDGERNGRPARVGTAPAPETLAYVCISNASELTSRLRQTAMGRVMEDEQLRPFVKHLYGSASEAFALIQDRIGGTLDELLQVVRGEIAVAVVAAELREGAEGPPQSPLQLVVFADVGDRLPLAERFLDALGDRLVASGAARSRTEAGATTITAIDSPAIRGNWRISSATRCSFSPAVGTCSSNSSLSGTARARRNCWRTIVAIWRSSVSACDQVAKSR